MKNITIGIMAHVDAGKTTLSEGLLYAAGMLKKTGRVDHGDAFLDTYALEKERGITIFSKQAVMPWGTLIDTPGHVDFAPETERVLGILDYAILVISASDGVQGHTATLWRLLNEYDIPTFIFVNKTDLEGFNKEALMNELTSELSDGCVSFSGNKGEFAADVGESSRKVGESSGDMQTGVLSDEELESIAMLDENVMDRYLSDGKISDDDIKRLILERKLFPVFFGSALKNEGVAEFYMGVEKYTLDTWSKKNAEDKNAPFAARVYKITRDDKGARLTHIRVISGELKPKDEIKYVLSSKGKGVSDAAEKGEEISEKIDQIRRYDGVKYELLNEAEAGVVCALTGLKNTFPGQGLGALDDMAEPLLEPVLNYRLILPEGVSVVTFLPKMRELEQELPELHVSVQSGGTVTPSDPGSEDRTDEKNSIHVQVMGRVQTEILQEVIRERYGIEVGFGQSQIVYKETVKKPVEGIGHYEPLKHYAEVHVGIEPLPAGSGVIADMRVSTDELDLNWQRLIVTHILEREHPGVRIGAPLTDVCISVIGGRAHLKHTEGGDFRQATYRAIRMGLMKTECTVLEPYYDFRLSVPMEQVGRAMTDIERMSGTFTQTDAPGGSKTVLVGHAPVATMQDYAAEVAAYTKGQGELGLSFHGYLPCHNETELVEKVGYDPEADTENLPGSVFCEHGAGFYVPWNEVEEKCHVHTDWKPGRIERVKDDGSIVYAEDDGDLDIYNDKESNEEFRLRMMDEALGVEEIDSILDQAINANRRAPKRSLRRAREKTVRRAAKPSGAAKPRKTREKIGDYLLVDGYNVIHAWKELSELAKDDMEMARGRLSDILCDYQGYTGRDVILVFDAYRVASHATEAFDYHNIHVVYTKTAETADQYIERFSVEKADRYHVTVVTSDGLEQIIIRGAGAHLLSARDFEAEVSSAKDGAFLH